MDASTYTPYSTMVPLEKRQLEINASRTAAQLSASRNDSRASRSVAIPQLRSRVTVVCGECKRLKLKCDRKHPCSSCVKRDSINRCVYTDASADKVDLHNVHNRICDLELLLGPWQQHGTLHLPKESFQQSHMDRSLIAVGNAGSSLIIPTDEISMLYISDLGSDAVGTLSLSLANEPPRVSASAAYSPFSQAAVKADTASSLAMTGPPPPSLPPFSHFTQSAAPRNIVRLLPIAPSIRRKYLNAAAVVMQASPSFNWRHLRHRIDDVLRYADMDQDLERLHGDTQVVRNTAQPPSASLFAATAATFALGSIVCNDQSDQTPDLSDPSSSNSDSTLFALSVQSLMVHEFAHSFDLDYLIACILQVSYLLHNGQTHVAQQLYPLVGKMVHISMLMGLATDPAPFSESFSIFEAETRRRIWWEVFCLDVFVSDVLGKNPMIQDNMVTTRMPADVDDDAFSATSISLPMRSPGEGTFSYFTLKCQLARLVKNTKKKLFCDPVVGEPSHAFHTALSIEQEVKDWLTALPSAYKFDIDSVPSSDGSTKRLTQVELTRQTQKTELAVTAHRLILKIWLPFLCRSLHSTPPTQVVVGALEAAHVIISAAKVLRTTISQAQRNSANVPRPPLFHLYAFRRALFDAAVICGHIALNDPGTILSRNAKDDLACALEIMRDELFGTKWSTCSPSAESPPTNNAVAVIQMLHARTQAGVESSFERCNHAFGSQTQLGGHFRLPFLGPPVILESPTRSTPPTHFEDLEQTNTELSVSSPRDMVVSTMTGTKRKRELSTERSSSQPRRMIRSTSASFGSDCIGSASETCAPYEPLPEKETKRVSPPILDPSVYGQTYLQPGIQRHSTEAVVAVPHLSQASHTSLSGFDRHTYPATEYATYMRNCESTAGSFSIADPASDMQQLSEQHMLSKTPGPATNSILAVSYEDYDAFAIATEPSTPTIASMGQPIQRGAVACQYTPAFTTQLLYPPSHEADHRYQQPQSWSQPLPNHSSPVWLQPVEIRNEVYSAS